MVYIDDIVDSFILALNFIYSTDKARELLGWSVNEDLESGLAKWKSWYESYAQMTK